MSPSQMSVYNMQQIKEDIQEVASLEMIYNTENPGFIMQAWKWFSKNIEGIKWEYVVRVVLSWGVNMSE